MAKNIVLYSAQLCGDCQKMKAFLDERGIDYELRDIKENPAYGEELEQQTGKLGVPYLIIDGEWVCGYERGVGFTETYAERILGL